MSTTPAREWREANRKEVTLPSGRTIEVRKLTAEFLLETRDVLEGAITSAEQGEVTAKLSPEQYQHYIEVLVRHGIARPKLAPASREPAEDELHARDFGADLDPAVAAVQEFNPEVLSPPFRSEESSKDAPPGGGDVRDAAEPGAAGEPSGPAV